MTVSAEDKDEGRFLKITAMADIIRICSDQGIIPGRQLLSNFITFYYNNFKIYLSIVKCIRISNYLIHKYQA